MYTLSHMRNNSDVTHYITYRIYWAPVFRVGQECQHTVNCQWSCASLKCSGLRSRYNFCVLLPVLIIFLAEISLTEDAVEW